MLKITGSEPILLSTKVSDLDKQHEIAKNIIITPPITRIEPDQSQNINFILKDGIEFDDEQILKSLFPRYWCCKGQFNKNAYQTRYCDVNYSKRVNHRT
ncbi:fimbrial chaperone [Proteus mirabilis]|uniref:Fimbrial chaperone n=1 Tax=Proteus mirabilis TaxID=584 RepID=A0A379F052_PROMI|nr:fimbrial chaperone [Proteus mirabilis]